MQRHLSLHPQQITLNALPLRRLLAVHRLNAIQPPRQRPVVRLARSVLQRQALLNVPLRLRQALPHHSPQRPQPAKHAIAERRRQHVPHSFLPRMEDMAAISGQRLIRAIAR